MPATTYYDVVTRYRTEDQASQPIERIGRSAFGADRGLARMRGSVNLLSGNFRGIVSVLGPLGAGMTLLGGIGFGLTKTFGNLNTELNSTLQLAAQVNISAAFSKDPVVNFNQSLLISKQLLKDLTRDAARLPGELSDFIGVARMTTTSILAGGGDMERVRALTSKIALVAPQAGTRPEDAGNQAMRILMGDASVGDNPLFRYLRGANLLPKSMLKLAPAERLERFDAALTKLSDNPMFREQILRTFDTQLGTLSDNLFGAYGIGGQIMRGPFNDLLDGLIQLNDGLTRNTPAIIESFDRILATVKGFLAGAESLYKSYQSQTPLFPGGAGLPSWAMFDIGKWFEENAHDWLYENMGGAAGQAYRTGSDTRLRYENEMWNERNQAAYEEVFGGKQKFSPKIQPNPNVEQKIEVKIDLKSETNPEAIAVRVREGISKAAKHPTVARRALGYEPTP